ncbi:hypothetical protein MRX96_015132 [Rhipicephalus microplus]
MACALVRAACLSANPIIKGFPPSGRCQRGPCPGSAWSRAHQLRRESLPAALSVPLRHGALCYTAAADAPQAAGLRASTTTPSALHRRKLSVGRSLAALCWLRFKYYNSCTQPFRNESSRQLF